MEVGSSLPSTKQRIACLFLQVALVCHCEQQTHLKKKKKVIHTVDQTKGREKEMCPLGTNKQTKQVE